MPQNLIDDKSTLVQVMSWCRQATSHYLNQCWPRSATPYGITRPQWVNTNPMNWLYNHNKTNHNKNVCTIYQIFYYINSLAPGRFKLNFREVISKLSLVIDGWSISCEIAHRWMPPLVILVQVMAGCLEATSHYKSQCWPRSMLPYGVTTPQWVNKTTWCRLLFLTPLMALEYMVYHMYQSQDGKVQAVAFHIMESPQSTLCISGSVRQSFDLTFRFPAAHFTKNLFICESNCLVDLFCCNSICCNQIITNFCTWHDSTAVMSCAKFCNDHISRTRMTEIKYS